MSDAHTFTVVFAIRGEATIEPFLDAAYQGPCADAAFMGPARDGTFAAEFDRESPSFADAVVSAIDDLGGVLPGMNVLRVEPDDLVTISAIAGRTGRTDESVRLLEAGKRGPGGFPPAIGHLNKKTRVWRWTEVADWFGGALGQPPPASEHAIFLSALNDALELERLTGRLRDHPDELRVIARFLPRPERLYTP